MPDPVLPSATSAPPPPPPPPPVVEIEPVVITGELRNPKSVAAEATAPLSDLATHCLAKTDGVVLAALGAASANPPIAILGGFKAGLELGECTAGRTADAKEQAQIRLALERCAAEGGTPYGTVREGARNAVICAVPEAR